MSEDSQSRPAMVCVVCFNDTPAGFTDNEAEADRVVRERNAEERRLGRERTDRARWWYRTVVRLGEEARHDLP